MNKNLMSFAMVVMLGLTLLVSGGCCHMHHHGCQQQTGCEKASGCDQASCCKKCSCCDHAAAEKKPCCDKPATEKKPCHDQSMKDCPLSEKK